MSGSLFSKYGDTSLLILPISTGTLPLDFLKNLPSLSRIDLSRQRLTGELLHAPGTTAALSSRPGLNGGHDQLLESPGKAFECDERSHSIAAA